MTQINTDFYLEAKTWLHAFAYLSSSYDAGTASVSGNFRTLSFVCASRGEDEYVFPPIAKEDF